jgi:hypothetical protein
MSDGASPGARMSRRALAVIALVLASASLTGCAESVTAPPQPTLAPPGSQPQAASCKGGYVLSDGRCG